MLAHSKFTMFQIEYFLCYARRPQGGGGWGAPREGPRCPEVPGCFHGALPGWPPPRAGRAGGAARGGGQENKKHVRFYDFWSFLANFCLFVSDFAWFGSVFPTFSRFFPRCVPRCVPTSGDRRVAVPGVIATSGTTPAGAPEVRPPPPHPGVVVRRTPVVLKDLSVIQKGHHQTSGPIDR